MQAEYPEQAARIGRGLQVLLTSDIRETAETGVYLVQTSEGRDLYYRATSLRCTCPDHMQRQVICKHPWALSILSAASAVAQWERRGSRSLVRPVAASEIEDLRQILSAPDPYWVRVLPHPTQLGPLDVAVPIPYELTAQGMAATADPLPAA